MEKRTWNLTHLYKTNNDFENDLKIVEKCLENIKKFKGKLNKIDVILDYFRLDTEMSVVLEKLAVYAFCKKDDNGKDSLNVKNYDVINNLFSRIGENLAFAKVELSKLDETFLSEMKNDKRFADFDRTIEDIIRYKKHTLSESQEQMMSRISGFSSTDDIFSVLSNLEMNHGSFIDENGKEIKLSPQNYNLCMNNPNAEVRRRVMEAYYGEYGRLSQTYAGLLSSHIKYENFLAKEYGFDSVLDMKCYGEEVDKAVMLGNIKNVSARTDLLHRYFDVKKKILGLDEFYTSDIGTQIYTDDKKMADYEQVVNDISKSYEVLGSDYVEKLDEAVKNGWIDAFPRENKTSGGYTISAFGTHPYILLNFDGTREWASALTHEFGHAMHSYYSAENQPYPKSSYTLFVAEIVSLLNEILYNRYLISKTTDKKEKMKLLAEFLQLFELNVYDSSLLAEFELFIHEELQKGGSLTAEDYSSKFKEIAQRYFGKGVKLCKNYEYGWSRKSHIYRDYYLYKYSLGLCCACSLSEDILNDKTGEALKKYKKFLTLGGSMDPVSELKIAGLDVTSEEIYKKAFKMFENYLENLENLAKNI